MGTPWDEARASAAEELTAHGLERDTKGRWHGPLRVAQATITVSVVLPEAFPHALPEVHVDRTSLPARVPHVEKSGKLCLVRPGALLDAENPRGLVSEALEKARTLLHLGISGANKGDLIDEFLAYWEQGATEEVWSLCDVDGPSRRIVAGEIEGWPKEAGRATVLADKSAIALDWAARLERRFTPVGEGMFARLETAFPPPDFHDKLPLGALCDLLEAHATADTWTATRAWLDGTKFPARLLLSLPVSSTPSRTMALAVLRAPTREELKVSQHGFRAGRGPTERDLALRKNLAVTRGRVRRVDAPFLLTRAGERSQLATRAVVVVGCGSVGCRVADGLASAGTGDLRLVDVEDLLEVNVHRHLLGINSVGINKAVALRQVLQRRYPHIDVQAKAGNVRRVLTEDPPFVQSVDLVVMALGDETLERELNAQLHSRVRRLHVWVEPHGVGQHCLLTGLAPEPGCFHCLFSHNPTCGLHNTAAFTAPGQAVDRTFAGCVGSFVPFSFVDATRAAAEAVALAICVLEKPTLPPVLVSRFGGGEIFLSQGLQLSPRAGRFRAGEVRQHLAYSLGDCPVCAATT